MACASRAIACSRAMLCRSAQAGLFSVVRVLERCLNSLDTFPVAIDAGGIRELYGWRVCVRLAYEATRLRRHFLLVVSGILPYERGRDISIGSIQGERMDMTGELPIFRSIKQPGQFCCSGCASWSNQQFRQGEQLMKSCITAFVIAGIEYLHDFIQAYKEIQLRHLSAVLQTS